MRPAFLHPSTARRSSAGHHVFLAGLWALSGFAHAASLTWTNTAGGSWNTAANWSPNAVPGATDTAKLTTPGNYTVILDAPVDLLGLELGASSGTGTQSVSPGNFALNLSSSGVIHRQGRLDWSPSSTWKGALTVETGGVVTFTNTGTYQLYGVLTNFGTVQLGHSVSATTLYGYGPTQIHNHGLWLTTTDQNTALINADNVPGKLFQNAGTLRKSGAGTATIGWPFNSTGTVEQSAGRLEVSAWTGLSTVRDSVTFVGGLGSPESSVVVASNAVVNVQSGPFNGNLLVAAGGTLNLTNAGSYALYGAWTNQGTVVLGSANGVTTLYGYGTALIENQGVWLTPSDQNSELINADGVPGKVFQNPGVIRQTGRGTLALAWPFTTRGTLDQARGLLDVSAWRGTNVLHGAAVFLGGIGEAEAAVEIADGALVSSRNGPLAGAVTVAPGGTLFLTNAVQYALRARLTNSGTVQMGSPSGATTIYGYGSAVIHNAGQWILVTERNPTLVNAELHPDRAFINVGTLRQTGGGTATVDWPVTTTGTLEQVSGTLDFANWRGANQLRDPVVFAGAVGSVGATVFLNPNAVISVRAGPLRGGLTVGAGAVLNLTNAVSYTLSTGLTNHGTVALGSTDGATTLYGYESAQIHNHGLWLVRSERNPSIINADANPLRWFNNEGRLRQIGGGTLTLDWPFTTTGTLEQSGSALDIVHWQGTNLVRDPVVIASALGAPTAFVILTNQAVLSARAGPVRGQLTVLPGTTLNFTNATQYYLYGSIVNQGTTVVGNTGGSTTLYGWETARLQNDGLWVFQSSRNPSLVMAEPHPNRAFINSGTLRQTGNGGASIDWPFTTTGRIEQTEGHLDIVAWLGTSTLQDPVVLGAALGGADAVVRLQSPAVVSVSAGPVRGAVTVNAGATLNFTNAAQCYLYAQLTNHGTVVHGGANGAATLYGWADARIQNEGLWLVQSGGNPALVNAENHPARQFLNHGTFRHSGNGSTTLDWPFVTSGQTEVQQGILNLARTATQSAGSLQLNGGQLTVNQPLQLLGGSLSGTNTLNGPVLNSGTVSPGGPGAGQLTINGDYQQTALGRLSVELGGTQPGQTHDRLAITGTAKLDGSLDVTLLDPYLPAAGNAFRIATFGAFQGDFATTHGLSIATNLSLTATLLGTALDLVTVSTNTPATAPAIVTQPLSLTIINGQDATFLTSATGTRPLAYQWQFQGTNLPGENRASLFLVNAQTNRSGAYRLVVTNAGGTAISDAAVLNVRPVADLVVTELSHATNALAGQSFSLSWRTRNQGSQTAPAPWLESVALSTNASGLPALPIASFPSTNALTAGQSQTRDVSVILPAGADGLFYFVVTTDAANQVVEELHEDNNTTVSTIPVRLRSPDLQPLQLSAAATAQLGQTLAVTWITTNAGSAPANVAWNDRLYLSKSATELTDALPMATVATTNLPLAEGTLRTNRTNVLVPLSADRPPGAYFLVLAVDAGNAVAESRETNNLIAAPLALTLPPLPDLVAGNLLAPISATPGELISLRWNITNQGSLAITSAWSETVYLTTNAAGAGALEVGTFTFTNVLAPGAFLTRTQDVTAPLASPLGNTWLAVLADSRNEIFEGSETNNLGIAATPTAIPARLCLQLSATAVREGAALPVLVTVTRNGNLNTPLAVTLTNSDDTEIKAPAGGAILAGQASVTLEIFALSDHRVDGPKTVTLTAAAPDFAAATGTITVLDADQPKLSVTLSEPSVSEGNSISGTVTRDAGTAQAVTVSFVSTQPRRVPPPAPIVLAAGQASGPFTLVAPNDVLIESDLAVTLTASAGEYVDGSATVTVRDDDLPQLILFLASSTVSEGAGPQATVATVRRSPVTSQALTLEIESTHPDAARVPSRVTLPAGEATVSFPIAAVDNDLLDGPKTTRVQSWILATGTSVRLSKGPGADLTVTDDDGPTLKLALASALVAEGLNPATTGTLSRNAGTNNALLVTLESSAPKKATVPASVTFPAGATAVSFAVTSLADGVIDGNVPVTITARAPGFTSATDRLVVSDASRPDLMISSVTAPATAETEAFVNLGYQIRNQGTAPMASNTLTQRIYLSRDPLVGGDLLVGEYTFSGALPPGSQFGQTFAVRLPQAAGDYWVIVETDTKGVVAEILEDNNTQISRTPLHVTAAYTATVATSLQSAPAGTPVPLTGRAVQPGTGKPVPFVLVNLHLHVRGTHRIIAALTDALGNFTTTWQPLPGEAGFYEIGAAHPGDADAPDQDTFALYGLVAAPAAPTVKLLGASTITGQIELANPGDLPLHGLAAQVLDAPGNLDIVVSLGTNVLAELATQSLTYTLTARGATVGPADFRVRLTSTEGATLEVPFTVTVESLEPRLAVLPDKLVRGLTRGQQTLMTFSVTNSGGAASGPLTVSLPPVPWIHLASATPLPSLAPGEAALISLQLTPPGDLPLTAVTGTLAVSAGEQTVAVPFEFRALSGNRGDLRVIAADEFTYFGEGAPPLTNAAAILRDALTGIVVTNGVTSRTGEWAVSQIPEGYYELEVTADKHSSYKATQFLKAGETNSLSAFLSRQTVRYTWTVVPTEIEDRYRIVVETEFEANVPAPVVTIEPSVIDLAELGNDPLQVDLTVTNHGLIAAQDFELQFDEHPDVQFEPLISRLGTLPAKSTFTIPLVIRRVAPGSTPTTTRTTAKAAPGILERIGSCLATARGVDQFKCGGLPVVQVTTISFPNAGNCLPGIALPGLSWLPGGPGGGSRPPPPIIRDVVPPRPGQVVINRPQTSVLAHYRDLLLAAIYQATPVLAIPSLCDPECQGKLVPAILKCFDVSVPEEPKPDECAEGLKDCAHDVLHNPSELTAINCMASGITCGLQKGLKKFPILSCVYEILAACAPEPEAAGAVNAPTGRRARPLALSGPYSGLLGTLQTRLDRLLAVQDHYIYFYGDSAWFETDDQLGVQAFFGRFSATIGAASTDGPRIALAEAAGLLGAALPAGINPSHVNHLIERWNRSVAYWHAGVFRLDQVPSGDSKDFLALDEVDRLSTLAVAAMAQSEADGFTSLEAGLNAAKADLAAELSLSSGGTCAKLKLRLDQSAVLSREAFQATLEIDNREGNPLENLRVSLGVLDADGKDASARFAIRAPEFAQISGTNGNGRLPSEQTRKVFWTLIPTTDAAPAEATQYFVSGGLYYSVNGNTVAIPLSPAAITVHPSPRLTVQYFHQRDVFSDDPHTDLIEPAVPFSLGLLVKNQGQGVARDFHITSAQPEIVENEKGLLADFKILATEVAGKSLEPTLTAALGDIGPGTNAIARWLLTSTIQGLFIDYHATFEHVTGLGNAKLSLIDAVSIHELNHVVQAGGTFADGRPDFLVNDVPDLHDYPDTLYFSDGSTNRVQMTTNAVISGTLSAGQLQVQLSSALPGGWAYLRIPDPGNGRFQLVGVVRSDQQVLGVDTNVWTTDRTFIGLGRRPIRENILHLLDYNSTGSYTLLYQPYPEPDTTAPKSAVAVLPAESSTGIPLRWSGSDDTGVVAYDIFVSVNGGLFTPWLTGTSETRALYPGVLGGSYAFYSLALDAAGNRELPPATPDAQTRVSRTNRASVFAALTNATILEGQVFVRTLTAVDPDGDAVSYTLGDGAPAGAVLDPTSGQLVWVTGEAHGPGTNRFTVIARDGGFPPLSTTASFQLIVLEDNAAPTLAPLANRSLNEGQLLSVTNVATDTDLPRQSLTFRLPPGQPAGVALDPITGVLTWRPSDTQGGTTNTLSVVVTDNGPVPRSATQSFTVIVRDTHPDFVLTPGGGPLLSGQNGSVPLTLHSGLDLTNVVLLLDLDNDRLINLSLQNLAASVARADLQSQGSNRYQLQFRTLPDTVLQGDLVLAHLDFGTVSNPRSAIIHLRGAALTGSRASGTPTPAGQAGEGTLYLIGRDPILIPGPTTPPQLGLTLYGEPGVTYGLERRASLDDGQPWIAAGTLKVSSLKTDWVPQLIRQEVEFFRAYRVVTGALSLRHEDGRLILEWPADCAGCRLEETRDLGPGARWTPTATAPQQRGAAYRVTVPDESTGALYRLVQPTNR